MDDFKWLCIAAAVGAIGMSANFCMKEYRYSIEKPELQKLQQECIQEGYGKVVNGKFELIKIGKKNESSN